jgi:hypothetical protein
MSRRAITETARYILGYVYECNRQIAASGQPPGPQLSAADLPRLEHCLTQPFQPFFAELPRYAERYRRFIRRLGNAGKGAWRNALKKERHYARLGGALFGPLGEIGGAWLGGVEAGNEAQEKIEAAWERLDGAFTALTRACGHGMTGSRDVALAILDEYHRTSANPGQNALRPGMYPVVRRQS